MLDTRLKRIAQRPSWNQISAPALSRQVHLRFLWSNLPLFARRRRRDLDSQIYLPIYPNRHLTRSIDRLLRARKLIVKTDPLAQVVHEILAHEVWERARVRACLCVYLCLKIVSFLFISQKSCPSVHWQICILICLFSSAIQSVSQSVNFRLALQFMCRMCRTNERTNEQSSIAAK